MSEQKTEQEVKKGQETSETKPQKDSAKAKEEVKEGEKPAKVKKAKARKRSVPTGNVYVQASYNNTIVTITEPNGDVIAWSSSGSSGFKGARKSTPYAAQISAENAAEKAKMFGLEKVQVFVKGVGSGREQSIRGLVAKGIDIISITDVTPSPHNGCRKKKGRRV